MKKITYLLPILFLFIVFSCDDDSDPDPNPTTDYQSIDVITGVDFFDINGQTIGRWGFPNHKTTDDIFAYPIPNNGIFSISSQEGLDRIWLVAADCMTDSVTVDIPTLSQNLSFEIADLEAAQIKDISITDFMDVIQLDFSDVATGFYKVFYQTTSDEIYWHNMYIDPTVNQFPTFDFMENNCL